MRPATEETGADAWEKAELAKIKDRYLFNFGYGLVNNED